MASEEQKKASSVKMKAHWDQVRAIREKLGCNLSHVSGHLAKLKEAGLVEKVLAGDGKAIRDALDMLSASVGKELDRVPGTNDVKIMLWAINKIGSIEAAEKAFTKAKGAIS